MGRSQLCSAAGGRAHLKSRTLPVQLGPIPQCDSIHSFKIGLGCLMLGCLLLWALPYTCGFNGPCAACSPPSLPFDLKILRVLSLKLYTEGERGSPDTAVEGPRKAGQGLSIMVVVSTFPGVGTFSTADEKTKIDPGLHSSTSSSTFQLEGQAQGRRLDHITLWKRDRVLVPLLGLLFLVMFLDRTNIANARIEGLEAGLKMPSNGYNTALWIFYIPFVLAEIPSNLLLNTELVKPNWFLGGQMAVLGMPPKVVVGQQCFRC